MSTKLLCIKHNQQLVFAILTFESARHLLFNFQILLICTSQLLRYVTNQSGSSIPTPSQRKLLMRGCVFIKFKTTVSHTLQCTVSSFERSSETRWRNIKLLLMHVSQRVACWLQKRDCVWWSKQIYWAGLELVTQLRGELVPPWYILIESCEKKRTVV